MEAVDELEAERNEQGDEEQDIGYEGRDLRAGRIDIFVQTIGDEQQPAGQDAAEQDHGQRIEALVEVGAFHCRLDRAG